ncbi:hypothetical protein C2E25_06530 [Geothermobacter hydrogeniphilus]|uniref:SxtJ n=2 Tax=Geothermobacter hydrogeniphilus TaxID=1969733 RepID=A0A2K2HB87_9BACT|nr:hypothetical protein C2E25_06530 [Geothermobacter hydrogeniphilus]
MEKKSMADSQLRWFGLGLGGLLLFAAGVGPGYFTWLGNVLCLAAAAGLLCAWLAPSRLMLIYGPWMKLAAVVGGVMTRLVLVVVFVLVVFPTGLIARLSGKCFLEKGPDPDAVSYWQLRDTNAPVGKNWERQF